MQNEPLTSDPVLSVYLEQLDQLACEDHGQQSDASHAKRICELSRDIRTCLSFPWEHNPALVDFTAEHLSDAVASIRGIGECAQIRAHATHVLQRAISILQDKHDKTEKPWFQKLQALQTEDSARVA